MNSSVVSSHTNGPARPHRRTNDGVVYVKRLPRCNEDEDQNENEGEGEGEGETRLIKRRPPPSANGPTVQELHAGNCCANTTTFILQPLGKRIYYSKRNTAPFSFSPFNLTPSRASFILFSLFGMRVLDDEYESKISTRSLESLWPAYTVPATLATSFTLDRFRIMVPDTITRIRVDRLMCFTMESTGRWFGA